jgi:hypothetical protein
MSDGPQANIPQAEFLMMKKKFRAFVAGFGSGKTYVGCMGMCQHFLEFPRINQGYFAPTYPQIRDIFYPTIQEVAEPFGLKVKIKTGDKEVDFYSGSRYRGTAICRSMDNPSNIVGFKIGHALVDELDVMSQEKAQLAWRKIIARMRYQSPQLMNGIDVTTTPEGFKFTYQMFVESIARDEKMSRFYGLVQASTYDNELNLPDDYIPSLEATYPAELIDAYLRGQFVNLTSGTVYRSYNRITHRSSEAIQKGEPLFIGQDFNVGKMASVIYVKRSSGYHAVAELADLFDTPDVIRVITDRWKSEGHRIIMYPDASGKNRKTGDASQSDLNMLHNAGFELRVNNRNPAVKDRVLATNAAYAKGLLWINDRECPTFAKCQEQQAYNKAGEPDKESGCDHMNDAGTYPIAFEMPIIRPKIIHNSAPMPITTNWR